MPLEPGREIRCPHRRRWHPVRPKHATGTDYTRLMLYFTCRGAEYYAGQIGGTGRHQVRRTTIMDPGGPPGAH